MRNVAVHDSPDRRAMLFQLLIESVLVVATPTPEPGVRTAGPEESVTLRTGTDNVGSFLPVFTDLESLSRFFPEGSGYLSLAGTTLFAMAEQSGLDRIALDPGSPTSGFITRPEFEALARGRLPIDPARQFAQPGTQLRLGLPRQPPPAAAIEAVRRAIDPHSVVVRAFVHLMQQGDAAPEMTVSICFRPGSDPAAQADATRSIAAEAAGRVRRDARVGLRQGRPGDRIAPGRRVGSRDLPTLIVGEDERVRIRSAGQNRSAVSIWSITHAPKIHLARIVDVERVEREADVPRSTRVPGPPGRPAPSSSELQLEDRSVDMTGRRQPLVEIEAMFVAEVVGVGRIDRPRQDRDPDRVDPPCLEAGADGLGPALHAVCRLAGRQVVHAARDDDEADVPVARVERASSRWRC